MQLQSLNSVHKCTTGGYCPWVKNYAGMRRVLQNIIPCEQFTPLTYCAIQWKREMVFPWQPCTGDRRSLRNWNSGRRRIWPTDRQTDRRVPPAAEPYTLDLINPQVASRATRKAPAIYYSSHTNTGRHSATSVPFPAAAAGERFFHKRCRLQPSPLILGSRRPSGKYSIRWGRDVSADYLKKMHLGRGRVVVAEPGAALLAVIRTDPCV